MQGLGKVLVTSNYISPVRGARTDSPGAVAGNRAPVAAIAAPGNGPRMDPTEREGPSPGQASRESRKVPVDRLINRSAPSVTEASA